MAEPSAAESEGEAAKRTRTKMESLREKFAVFDRNSDGVLTRDEIRSILTRPSGGGARTMNMKMANDFLLMFQFDKRACASDTFQPVLPSNLNQQVSTRFGSTLLRVARSNPVFAVDKDGNGTIDIDEFVGALLPGVAKQVFDEFDKEKKGEIDASQLPSMLSQLSMKKGKKLDGVKADVGLGDKMVLNDFIKVAATMHARKEPVEKKEKKVEPEPIQKKGAK